MITQLPVPAPEAEVQVQSHPTTTHHINNNISISTSTSTSSSSYHPPHQPTEHTNHLYLLFLDIDGVLNNTQDLESTFTKESLYTLQSLKVYIPSLHIVCTSTWRLQNESLK